MALNTQGPDVSDLDNEDAGKGPGRRRREKGVSSDSGEKNYTESDVHYVGGTPRVRDGQLEATVFVKHGGKLSTDQFTLRSRRCCKKPHTRVRSIFVINA